MGEGEKSCDKDSIAQRQQQSSSGSKPYSRPLAGTLEIPEEEVTKEHRFWDRQPVPSIRDGDCDTCGPIDNSTDVSKIRTTPLSLPEGYDWVNIDVKEESALAEVHELLQNHYVEDTGACFRFDYSMDCLTWAMSVPNMHEDWSIGVKASMRSTASDAGPAVKKLVAFISGIPIRANVHGNSIAAAEINFLCVHKSLRSKRLAPVLIKEITRRINLANIWQAVYTAGVFIPRPVADCRYYHRPLNIEKLIRIGFSSLRPNQSLTSAKADLLLPDDFTLPNIRSMEKKDVPAVAKILKDTYVRDNIKLYVELDEFEVEHWLLPKAGVVQTFVKENDAHEVTDVFSYYLLPSTVLKYSTDQYKTIEVAYSYHSAGQTMSRTELLEQTIIGAKKANVDVVNALNLHGNYQAFQQLKFGPGDGSLKYYLYNYKCPMLRPEENAVILL